MIVLKFIKMRMVLSVLEWDKEDPNWAWLNGLTSKQLQVIIEQAIKDYETSE